MAGMMFVHLFIKRLPSMRSAGRRRQRGRPPKRDAQCRQQGSAFSRTDTEAESQQQQSSNRATSGRDAEARDEERSEHQPLAKGIKRPGKLSGKTIRGRGRPPKEARRSMTHAANDTPMDHRNATMDGCGVIRSNDLMHGTQRTIHPASAFRGMRRGSIATVDESSGDEDRDGHVESEGENDVEDGSEQRLAPYTAAGSDTLDETCPLTCHPPNKKSQTSAGAGDTSAVNFSFPVFEDSQGIIRARNASYVLPIAVGSIALWQGKKAPEKKCYQWVVYVRSPGSVDLSHVVKRVRFQLHTSFPHPERIISHPPYELEETGWGEFDIPVTLEFHDDICGPPVELLHSLKLYTTSEPSTRVPVRNEKYEELVFSEPPAAFFQRVKDYDDQPAPNSCREELFPMWVVICMVSGAILWYGYRYRSHLVNDCMDRIDLVRTRLQQEARALVAKAESRGVSITSPTILRLIEQNRPKDEEFLSKPAPTLQRLEDNTMTHVRLRTHLVIDADNPEAPLTIRTEQPKKRTGTTRSDEARHHTSRSEYIRGDGRAEREIGNGPQDQKDEEAMGVCQIAENNQLWEGAEDGETSVMAGVRTPGALAPSFKMMEHKRRDRLSIDDLSPTFDVEPLSKRHRGDGFDVPGDEAQVGTDSKGSGNGASLAEVSPKESGSSYGAESGT